MARSRKKHNTIITIQGDLTELQAEKILDAVQALADKYTCGVGFMVDDGFDY